MERYGDDLAYIHDTGFGWFANGAGPGILGILREHGITSGRVVDLGCGSGLWARALADAGYDAFGVDQSAPMLRIARKRVPGAKFVHSSFLTADLPECVAVTSMGEALCYLFDNRNGLEALAKLFHRVHEALQPLGLLIFDVIEPNHGASPQKRWFQGPDWAVLLTVEEDREARVLTRHMTTFRKVGRLYRRGEETHRVRLYRGTDVGPALRSAGFRVRIVRNYGAFRLPHRRVGFVARKSE